MLFLVMIAFSVVALIATIAATQTKNIKLLKMMIKQKPEETDDAYFARASKSALYLSIGFIVLGVIGFFF